MWSKMTLFEPATRVPLFMSVPGMAKGKAARRIVESLDIYPTLTDICGLKVPSATRRPVAETSVAESGGAVGQARVLLHHQGPIKGATVRTALPLYRVEPGRTGRRAVRLHDRSDGEPQSGAGSGPCRDGQVDEEAAGCGLDVARPDIPVERLIEREPGGSSAAYRMLCLETGSSTSLSKSQAVRTAPCRMLHPSAIRNCRRASRRLIVGFNTCTLLTNGQRCHCSSRA